MPIPNIATETIYKISGALVSSGDRPPFAINDLMSLFLVHFSEEIRADFDESISVLSNNP